MEVLEHQYQGPAKTDLDAELAEDFERLLFESFGVRQRGRSVDILDFQQVEKDGTVLVRIHSDRLQARTDLLGDRVGRVRLANPPIAAQQIEREQVRDLRAIGQAAAFDPGDAPLAELAAELGDEPRLADTRLADDTDDLAAAAFDLPHKIVQDRDLALAIDKCRHPSRYRLTQPGAAMGN